MAITNGSSLNSVPAPTQQTLVTNYLDFNTDMGWAQQYLPDLMEREAEVFGPRTISGFLSQVGAEEAMQADQVIWSEQGRLHLSYKCDIDTDDVITIQQDIDGNTMTTNAVRLNDTVIVAAPTGVYKGLVTAISSQNITVKSYDATTIPTSGNTADYATTLLVYGSEYVKGVGYNQTNAAGTVTPVESRGANEPDFKTFSNKPIIMKDYYEVSGSDTARIGWVETTGETGQSGYMWYLKAEADTRARFTDYLEMAMLEGEIDRLDASSNAVEDFLYGADGTKTVGTEGLFAAITARGNLTSGVTGVNAATDLAEFDAILAEFDSQGAIEENMMFVNRATSLAMDDMLASMNSYGAGGTSYGVFNNSEDMALNLGFSGFRRGSYDFYKSDFRYLNDKATRGGINSAYAAGAIRGVMVPAGTSTVYDQSLGKNLKRPFLHVRYRASQTDDRKLKTWVTGSVGAATSALDAMQIHMLSERCLVTQGANNFMLMK
jgi:hypothetical protein